VTSFRRPDLAKGIGRRRLGHVDPVAHAREARFGKQQHGSIRAHGLDSKSDSTVAGDWVLSTENVQACNTRSATIGQAL